MKKNKAYLIGRNIHRSYSKEIYSMVLDIDYNVKNFQTEDELASFLEKKRFLFVNVTSPYKKFVVDYLDYKSDLVKKLGVCNLIVNKNGILKGYNTDAYGFEKSLRKNGIKVDGKNILILGNGATSETIKYVLEKENAKSITVACRRTKKEGEVLFKNAPRDDVQIIINTTPCGNNVRDRKLVQISNYKDLEVFVDVLYSSYKTPLMVDAKEQGKGAVGGIDMLVFQAEQAVSISTGKILPTFIWREIRNKILFNHVNLVLIGLPTSGKTQMCKKLEKQFNQKNTKAFFDSDKIIEDVSNETISQIFKKHGEEHFRNLERAVIEKISKLEGVVISTGGGCVIGRENYQNLSKHGFFIYLKKTKFDDFVDNGKRPLAKSVDDLKRLYKERNPIYERRSDLTISAEVSAEKLIEEACDAIANS